MPVQEQNKKRVIDPLFVLYSVLVFRLVPEVGIEPTRSQGPVDFESTASTNFTTPAEVEYYKMAPRLVNTFFLI